MKGYWISLTMLCGIEGILLFLQISTGIFSVFLQEFLSICFEVLLCGNLTSFMTWLLCSKGEMPQIAIVVFLYLCINIVFLAMTGTYVIVGLLAF